MINDESHLREKMGEMSTLAHDDPRRCEFEQHVADAPSWVQREWSDLLAETDVLRDCLSKVDIPGDFEDRLLSVSAVTPRSHRRVPRKAWVSAAAIALVALGLLMAHRSTVSNRMKTIALLAINNHLNHLADHGVHGETKVELETALSDQIGFEVIVPDLGPGMKLAGGRKCKLGTHAVAFSLWRDEEADYSLFQFQPKRFGLPHTIEPKLVHTTQPAGSDHDGGAWIWTDGGTGFVLTGDPGCDLRPRFPNSHSE